MSRQVELVASMWGDRRVPAAAVGEQARAFEASGSVSAIMLADHMTGFVPPQLWTPENTPMASVLSDPDSLCDVWSLAGYVLASAPSLGISIGTDSVRRHPAEMVQSMLTLASMSSGRATFQIGGGEVKNCRPFGHKRSQGMSRMEDLFRITHRFLESGGRPVDFEGKRYTLDHASLGGGMPHRPRIFGLGGGEQLIDYATSYADGLTVICPGVWASPEKFAAARIEILKQVADKGRDPEAFRFGLWLGTLTARDHDQLEGVLDNPIIKFMTPFLGRIDSDTWSTEFGLPSPVPEGWAYWKDLLPYNTSQAFIDETVSRVTRAHVDAAWLKGTASEVSDQIMAYVDAGADWVSSLEWLPMLLAPDEATDWFANYLGMLGMVHAAIEERGFAAA